MSSPQPSPSQTMADAIVDGALLVETGRIATLARQGLEDPTSLTPVQARQVFGAFLLLFDPLVSLRGESAPPPLISRVQLPPPVSLGSYRQPESVRPSRAAGACAASFPAKWSNADSESALVAVRALGRVLCRGTLTSVGLFVDVP